MGGSYRRPGLLVTYILRSSWLRHPHRNANDTGMSRLALSAGDKQVRDWLAEQATHLACDVKVDQMGNMFAVRAGKKPGLPTFMGSHLDTQPAGGRYDGVLGVLAALEGLRTLHDHGIQTEYPIGIVNWTKCGPAGNGGAAC